MVGPGLAAAVDGHRGLIARRVSGKHVHVHITQRVPVDWITKNDGCYVHRPSVAAHLGTNPTVTLLGDAAHLMPPVGPGADLVMLVAGELARALAGAGTVDDAIRTYENTMLPRSSEVGGPSQVSATICCPGDVPTLEKAARME